VVHHRPTDIRLSSKKAHRNPQAVPVARAQSKPLLLIPLTPRALFQRLARRLAVDGRVLRKTRAASARDCVGDYFVIDGDGGIVMHHVNLQELARELGVLQSYERLLAED
jgi:hypothetical protein